jgi:hypothetical protein
VFGLTEDPPPCQPASFEGKTATPITAAEQFTVDWDQTFAVVSKDGAMFEVELPSGTPTPIDLGVYVDFGLALAPEGSSLFYTAAIEPELLRGALRTGTATWTLDARVPRGTFAGTPSADSYGPRHVLVRLRATDTDVTEYEDVDGVWTPLGVHPVAGIIAPNLTPNGLVMVYSGFDEVGAPAIFVATRASRDEWFGEPSMLLPGPYIQPQLLGQCKQLYVTDGTTLQRFDQ